MGFKQEDLIGDLEKLPLGHCIAFSASCAERLLPNYEAFTYLHSEGNPLLLREILDKVWLHLEGKALTKEEAQKLYDECDKLIPDIEYIPKDVSIFSNMEIDCVSAVSSSLLCLIDDDKKVASSSALSCFQLTYKYIMDVTIASFDGAGLNMNVIKWVLEAPLLQAELAKQEDDIRSLMAEAKLSKKFLKKLRNSSKSMGIQPRARGLVVEATLSFI